MLVWLDVSTIVLRLSKDARVYGFRSALSDMQCVAQSPVTLRLLNRVITIARIDITA